MKKQQQTKYLIVLGDGMADYADSNGLTPLMEAHKPFIDGLLGVSELGLVQTVPDGFAPGSDVANLSVMGYNPTEFYTGRSPLEAVSAGVELGNGDICYRLNLVTLFGNGDFEHKIMADYSGGEIESDKGARLIELLKEVVPGGFDIYAGISYRNLLVKRCTKHGRLGATAPTDVQSTVGVGAQATVGAVAPNRPNGNSNAISEQPSLPNLPNLTPPHDITDQPITNHLPPEPFLSFIKKAHLLLNYHIKNDTKANAVWIWGQGSKAMLPDFAQKFGKRGAVISEVDLVKGIGICANMTNIDVDGADGSLHTNYEGMVQATIDAFKTHDFVYLHIEAPDECGHKGDRAGKIKAIEYLDSRVVKPLVESLTKDYNLRLLFLPDHATPLELKTHTSDAVPYMLYDSKRNLREGLDLGLDKLNKDNKNKNTNSYTEQTAKDSGAFVKEGHKLIEKLIKE